MAIKIDKLWRDPKFRGLSGLDKLVYIYLCSNGAISTLGVQEHDENSVRYFLHPVSFDEFCNSLNSLYANKFVTVSINRIMENKVTTVLRDHFKSLPRSIKNVRDAIEEYNKMSAGIRDYIDRKVKPNLDFADWQPPTPEEVHNYALSLGYNVNGNTFCDWYGESDWYDKRGKRVRNWKLKVRNVWCRDENKLKKVEGSPEGYEHWGINTEEGVKVYPEKWVEGKPYHSSISMDTKLKEAWGTVLLYKNVI